MASTEPLDRPGSASGGRTRLGGAARAAVLAAAAVALSAAVLAGTSVGSARAEIDVTERAAATEHDESSAVPEFWVANLGVGAAGTGGIQRTLNSARPGFAQAFTTGPDADGYGLGWLGVQISRLHDPLAARDHLRVTLNSAADTGGPGGVLCTLRSPESFSTPGVSMFAAQKGEQACPTLEADTTYFAVVEWVDPVGAGPFAVIPQTLPTEDSAATAEDPGGGQGWSIADVGWRLDASSDPPAWSAFADAASFKIAVKPGVRLELSGIEFADVTAYSAQVAVTVSGAERLAVPVWVRWRPVYSGGDWLGSMMVWTAGPPSPEAVLAVDGLRQRHWYEVEASIWPDFAEAVSERFLTNDLYPGGPPGMVTDGAAAPGDRQLVLTWEPPAADSGGRVYRYRIEMKRVGGDYSAVTTTTELAYTLTNLANGIEYTVRVTAYNTSGDGPSWEATAAPSSGADTALGTPVLAEPQPLHHRMVQLDWDDVDGADGYEVSYYQYQTRKHLTLPALGISVALDGSSAVVSDLPDWNIWFFRVRAVSDNGESEWSELYDVWPTKASDWVTNGEDDPGEDEQQEPQNPPPAPTALTASVNADGHVVLSWTAPDDDSVTGYQILRRRPYEGEPTLLVHVADTGSADTAWTDTDVAAGVRYAYRVKAINAAGVGARSNFANATP